MNYKYNELEYAKTIYENGFQTKHIVTELRLVATYLRRYLNYKPKDLREVMYNFCSKYIPEYNKVKHYKIINRAINQACKKGSALIKVDEITVYDYELAYIDTLQICNEDGEIVKFSYDCKKVVFTLLCLMKLNKHISKQKNGEESKGLYFKGGNKKYNDLKKASKINDKIKINDDIIYSLGQSGIITVLFNGLIKLNFMDDLNNLKESKTGNDCNVCITIKNFDNIGWYYDFYSNVINIKLCKHCNQPFKQTKHDILYCSEHKQYYIPIETKEIQCTDCGVKVEVDARNMTKTRCDECYKTYRRKKKTETMRKIRENQ
jgi:hypothetical protein